MYSCVPHATFRGRHEQLLRRRRADSNVSQRCSPSPWRLPPDEVAHLPAAVLSTCTSSAARACRYCCRLFDRGARTPLVCPELLAAPARTVVHQQLRPAGPGAGTAAATRLPVLRARVCRLCGGLHPPHRRGGPAGTPRPPGPVIQGCNGPRARGASAGAPAGHLLAARGLSPACVPTSSSSSGTSRASRPSGDPALALTPRTGGRPHRTSSDPTRLAPGRGSRAAARTSVGCRSCSP